VIISHNVLRFGSSCSSSINEQEKDEEKEVIPKAAAVSPNKIDKNHSRVHSKIGFVDGYYIFQQLLWE